jgi:hypothetical protein
VAKALHVSAYIILAEARSMGQVGYPSASAGWLNIDLAMEQELNKKSHSMNVAHRKLGELLDGDESLGEFADERGEFDIRRTPRPIEFTSGFKGGVRIGRHIIVTSKLASVHDQLFDALMFSAAWEHTLTKFSDVLEYDGVPLVVLKSRAPEKALEFIAWICEVTVDDFHLDGVNTRKSLIVLRTDGNYGPEAIAVVVEQE